MKKEYKYSKLFAATALVATAVAPAAVSAEDAGSSNESIVVANNVTLKDTVTVKNVPAKAKVNIYKADGKTLIVSKTASKEGDLEIVIPGGFTETTINVTLTENQKLESKLVPVTVPAEVQSKFSNDTTAVSTKPADTNVTESGDIKVTNNTDLKDVIDVTGLAPKDVIQVYTDSEKKNLLKKATVAAGKDSVSIVIGKFAEDVTAVYVTKTSVNALESAPIQLVLAEETQSAALTADNKVVVKDLLTGKDTVVVEGLEAKDVVKVYKDEEKTTVLGKGTVKAGATSVTFNTTELEGIEEDGEVFVTVQKYNETESEAFPVVVEKPTATDIEFTVGAKNNLKGKDTVTVSGLQAKDVVKVYAEGEDGEPVQIGQATAKGVEVTVSTKELTGFENVYVTVTRPGYYESETNLNDETPSENAVEHPDVTALTSVTGKAINAPTAKDSVVVEGLTEKAVVKVFSDAEGKTLLGQATVKAGTTSVTIAPTKDLKDIEKVYVSVANDGELDSSAAEDERYVEVTVEEPSKTEITNTMVFTAVNNVNGKDVVTAKGLTEKDIVNVYEKEADTKPIGTATVKSGATEAVISLSTQLSAEEDSQVYVTVTKLNELESDKEEVKITQPEKTEIADTVKITATNVIKGKDIVTVEGLTAKDVVTVYKEGADGADATYTKIGTAKASAAKLSINLTEDIEGSENVYVTVASVDKLESDKKTVAVTDPATSQALTDVTILDNVKGADIVKVASGVAKGDIVKVYGLETADQAIDAEGVKVIGKATASGTAVDVKISGTLDAYKEKFIGVTVTSPGEYESKALSLKVTGPEPSTKPTAITHVNNVTLQDTLTVTGLVAKDIVNVYKAVEVDGETTYVSIGKATVKTGATEATVNLTGKGAGFKDLEKVYVEVTSDNKLPSEKAEVTVEEETQSEVLTDVVFTNNVVEKDSVTIKGLEVKDVVTIYTKEGDVYTKFATTTAKAAGELVWTLSAKLPAVAADDASSTIYVSVTKPNELESDKAAFTFNKEKASTPLAAGDIVQQNNAIGKDTVTIKGLKAKDVATIYADADKKTVLGKVTAKAEIADGHVISLAAGLPAAEGAKIYVAVQRYNELESDASEVAVAAVPQSNFPTPIAP